MSAQVGEIRHVPEGSTRGAAGAWWVVVRIDGGRPIGECFIGAEDSDRWMPGGETNVTQCDVVPDEDVPEWVLVELAKYRLTRS